MANTIQIKRKTTTGAPDVSTLLDGEMCLVVPDSKLYQKVDASTLIEVNGGGSDIFYFPLGGGYLCDPNEYNGWGATGVYDDIITHDLGNVGAAVNRTAGGLNFPFKWKINRFFAWHYNNNSGILPWGWRINAQVKNAGSNARVDREILRECTGAGATAVAPRNYSNTTNQQTDIDLSLMTPIEPYEVLSLGVEAPTAITTNRYVYIQSGWFEIEKVP